MLVGVELIAEVKTTSPFDGDTWVKTWWELFDIANKYGDMLSIHTSARWGWSMEDISRAVNLTDKPILAKWIHESDSQIIEAIERWASYVLVVGRIPDCHRDKILYEVESIKQLEEFKTMLPDTAKFVWNTRNLEDGSLKQETFKQARALWDGWLCQASNIWDVTDVDTSAQAILVGTKLEAFISSI